MAITTTYVDGKNTIVCTATTDLKSLAKENGIDVATLLFNADRADDSLERTQHPLSVGDVIIINKDKVSSNNTVTEPQATTNEAKKDPIVTEEKVVGAVIGGGGGAMAGGALGAKIGAIGGPWGIAIGAVVGLAIGWACGDLLS